VRRHWAAPGHMGRRPPNIVVRSDLDGTFENASWDGGIRTRGLLLPNQLQRVAGRRRVPPGMAFTWDDAR
jgi:hypothetical protein